MHLFALVVICARPLIAAAQGEPKQPVPPDAAQQGALTLVKEVFGQEWADAKTDQQKQALAKKLLTQAGESQDATNKYVLLRVARDVATQAADGLTAFEAIDEMDRAFQVDAVAMKAGVIYSGTKQAGLPAQHKVLAEAALALLDEAILKDDFDSAAKLADMARDEARKARDTELVKTAAARRQELEEIAKAFQQAKTAAATLEGNPTDPDANLVLGRYRCFVKGDWGNGLPMLALGSDPVLKALAVKELEGVSGHAEQAALGDGWWDLAKKNEGAARQSLRRRAVFWYRKALPGLTGLRKEVLKERLVEFGARLRDAKIPTGAVLVLTFDRETFVRQGNKIFVKDLSGQANHGSVNGAQLVEGKAGDALSFDGKSSYVECMNAESLNPTGAFTVCAWTKARSWGGYLVSKDDWQKGHTRGYVLRCLPDGFVGFTFGARGWRDVRSNTRLDVGEWFHAAGTYDGKRLTIFINGQAAGTSFISQRITRSPYNLRIGRGHYASDRRFDGIIDEVAVFAKALTDAEIASIYQLGQQGTSLCR